MIDANNNKIEEPDHSDIAELLIEDVVSDEFGDSYDEPKEELADTESELYEHKVEKWAEDDEVLKQDLESEEIGHLFEQMDEGPQNMGIEFGSAGSDDIVEPKGVIIQDAENRIKQRADIVEGVAGQHVPRMYSYEWMKAEDVRVQREKKEREEAWKNTHPLKKIGFYSLLAFIFFVIIYVLSDPFSPNNPVTNCRNTTKEMQTIIKVDGEVDSIETETVDGCETPDGTFFQRSDF